jgi:multiple sugar transport system substrate-binding protein
MCGVSVLAGAMPDRLRVALVGGPMYDSMYEPFIEDVEVVVHADHPTLNRQAAELLASGERIDVLSTHGKYAPSQAAWLRPLDALLEPEVVATLAPRAVDLCRHRGALLCAPRNIDVRTLWWRTDRMDAPPDRWTDLAASSAVFGFTGRESGLFGLFFELVVGSGGALFDADGRPNMTGPEAVAAVALLCELAGRGPVELPDWHYDEVDAALLDGRVDCAAAWPGGFGPIRASADYDVLRPAPYLSGPSARVSYSGCHGWAIPTTCGDLEGAVELVSRLCSVEMHEREATAGGIPARTDVLARVEPTDATDAARLAITRDTIENGMITYPPLVRFPEVEDAGWGAIHDALRGELSPAAAVASIQHAAESVLE